MTDYRPGSTCCKHLNDPFECPECRLEAQEREEVPPLDEPPPDPRILDGT